MISILFLSANPDTTTKLKVEDEFIKIEERIHGAKYRDDFNLIQRHAVSLSKIQLLLMRFKPNIVHFSGHGSDEGKLIFENSAGKQEEADPKALSELFRIINSDNNTSDDEKIKLVVLSACYSEKQANSIARNVDCVIGISEEIKDDSAIAFAESFYQALGFGKSIQSAFDLGRNQLGLAADLDERILKLRRRQGIDPSTVILSAKAAKAKDSSLSDELKSITVGRINKEQVLAELNNLKEHTRKPYQVKLLCKGKDRIFKLPVLLYRESDSFSLIAKDGTEECQEITQDALVSRITDERAGHALVYTNGHRVSIKDLRSKNGVLVEDTALHSGESAVLNVGDRFVIGNTIFIMNDIITEMRNISQSKELWGSFTYTYVSLLDRLVEENDLDSFITRLEDLKGQFQKQLDPHVMKEIDDYIGESKSWFGRRSGAEIKDKWRHRIRDLILRS